MRFPPSKAERCLKERLKDSGIRFDFVIWLGSDKYGERHYHIVRAWLGTSVYEDSSKCWYTDWAVYDDGSDDIGKVPNISER